MQWQNAMVNGRGRYGDVDGGGPGNEAKALISYQEAHGHDRPNYQRGNHYRIQRPEYRLWLAAYPGNGVFYKSTISFQEIFLHD